MTTTPNTTTAFRKIKFLVAGYLGVSLLGVVAMVLMRQHPTEVNSLVWIQGVLLAVSALIAFNVAVRAARGSRWAYRRLRILSVAVVAAIAVKVALPASFPLWMKAELGLAGLLMVGVAVLANGSQLRARFAAQ